MYRVTGPLLLCLSMFFTTVKSQSACGRPVLAAHVQAVALQMFSPAGTEVVLSCQQGYAPLRGPRTIVCGSSGSWTRTDFMCHPKECPYPEPPANGDMLGDGNVYQSILNYTCNPGYVLRGAASAVCLHDATWSAPLPECQPVTCGLAPIPANGKIIYMKRVRGNTTDYGTIGAYECLPPYVLFGNAQGECTFDGTWTAPPKCRLVQCPPPPAITNGYMSRSFQINYDYMETIKYGCRGDYVLDGNMEIVCQRTGEWSQMPACMAPCSVGIHRGRILYKGQKLWITDLQPNRVHHNDLVSFYCLDKARKCGYAVSAQCINGKLKIPQCFEEPSGAVYALKSTSLPSEIQQC